MYMYIHTYIHTYIHITHQGQHMRHAIERSQHSGRPLGVRGSGIIITITSSSSSSSSSSS